MARFVIHTVIRRHGLRSSLTKDRIGEGLIIWINIDAQYCQYCHARLFIFTSAPLYSGADRTREQMGAINSGRGARGFRSL
jgi:hypothetical protein